MEKYIGVKLISAEPMNKGEAWNRNLVKVDTVTELTKEQFEEFYKTDGYKVVYEDGYTSWSPKDVFDKAYIKIQDGLVINSKEWQPHQERVISESQDLMKKVNKLEDFINNSNIFISLVELEQIRLKQQLLAMKYYATILIERIKQF